jgi:NAD(P)-dependent dehydrogenase (short-subunit alcohol dehydrogenase family)
MLRLEQQDGKRSRRCHGWGCGLGQLITRRLAHRGFVVAIADIDHDAAAELTAELTGQAVAP